MFLREVQQTKYKKIKLKQLLILLCRILMLLFLVMAFSRPFQKGYLPATGETPGSTVLFVLDNSFSMEVKSDSGSVFDEAKKKLIQAINLMSDNDEIHFVTTSNMGREDVVTYFENKDVLIDSIKTSRVSPITCDLDFIMYYSDRILSSSSNPFREIFFFSDAQKSTIGTFRGTPSELQKNENTKYNIVVCGKNEGKNISIDTVDIKTRIFQKNKMIKLKCTLTNHNNFNAANKTVSLNIEGDTKARDEKVIDIPANSSVEVEFSFVPGKTGFGGGYIELSLSGSGLQPEDEMISDNRRYFFFRIPEKVRILSAVNSDKDIAFVKLALSTSEELSKDSSGQTTTYFDLKQVNENDLARELSQPNQFDCIIISNKRNFSSQETEKLYEFVQNGGGLMIYPGDNSDVNNYNSVFFKKFELTGMNGMFGNRNGTELSKFMNVDLDHPVFDGIFKSGSNSLTGILNESPSVKFGYQLFGGINHIPLIRLNNEQNFLVEYSSGKGKIMFWSIAPTMEYSDFPSKNIFSPITVRSMLYLSNINLAPEGVAGKDYFFDLEKYNTNSSDSVELKDNSNIKNTKYISVQKNEVLNLKNYLTDISNYSITKSSKTIYEFPCNFDKSESNPAKMTESELRDLFANRFKLQPNIIMPEREFLQAVTSIRTGRELWKYFLILALVFLCAEFVISKLLAGKPSANEVKL